MHVIKPNPSQAAVVLKKYLATIGVEVPLCKAQEAIARSEGYESFQAFVSNVPMRMPASTLTENLHVTEFPSECEGFKLWSVVGRLHNDDDDGEELIWALPSDSPGFLFQERIWSYQGKIEPRDEDIESHQIYIQSETCLGQVIGGNFVLNNDIKQSFPGVTVPPSSDIAPNPEIAAFLQSTARMTMDGEEVDGEEFILENDDAVDSLHSLIQESRELCDKYHL